MAQLISVRLHKSDHQALGFRLQGGKDFGTPLVIQKVNGGSPADAAGLQAGDAVIRVNSSDVFNLRHQEAQDVIRASGPTLEITVQRGGGTWRPTVTPTGTLPRPGQLGAVSPVTQTSLKATPQPSQAFGSGHNSVAKPYSYVNGGGDTVKSIVNKQYNTPVGMYSDQTIAETLSAQTEVLAGGVLGVNFKKNEKTYDAEKSAVFKMLQEDANDPEPETIQSPIAPPISGLRHVAAPATKPDAPVNNTGGLPPGQNICEECERLIIGVFVRIKDKNLHVECFKCATCGTSLKNQGYYNLNGKLYCDIHAKLVARQHPLSANLEPVTVAPGGKIPSGTYSAPLSSHTTPLPPISTNYSNGSSSLFSPSSTLSGPKPFGSSGSAYSPSLSPRSAPLSPAARPLPVNHAAPPAPHPAYAPAPPAHPAYAPAPAPLPAYAPPAPAPNSDSPTQYVKPEYKSPAEERLIRKMAKMALNGYEIGIQRKIKPGDHLQTMANQIGETIVAKHPLNSENECNENNATNGKPSMKNGQDTLKLNGQQKQQVLSYSPSYKNSNFDSKIKPNEQILNIGDKIKDTIVKKHPSHQILTTNGAGALEVNVNRPAQLTDRHKDKNTHINTTNIMHNNLNVNGYSKNHENIMNNSSCDMSPEEKELQKYLNDSNMRAQFLTTILNGSTNDKSDHKLEKNYNDLSSLPHKSLNGRWDSHGESNKIITSTEKMETPNSKEITPYGTQKFNKSHNNFGGTLKKHQNNIDYNTKNNDNIHQKKDTLKSEKIYSPTKSDSGSEKDILYDNSLYSPKLINEINGTKGLIKSETYENSRRTKISDDDRSSSEKEESLKQQHVTDNCNGESAVKMRKKVRDSTLDGGKRDSHIISRPKSTITSFDFTDGTYPACHIDNKAITGGPFITALGRIWCPDHFVCVNASCRRQLQDIGFVEENGQLYCEYCFEQFIAPACDKCHAKIKGDCLNAIGKHFHPECFNCVYCGKLFGNNPFFLEDGLPYCEADWNELFTTKCFACGFPVEAGDRWVEALNNNYHSQCFNCTMCKKNLEGQSFFAKGGRPFCKNHAR